MNDLKKLNLDNQQESSILNIIEKDKLKWELWIESATNYKDLKNKLSKRGYHSMPPNDKPELFFKPSLINQKQVQKLDNQVSMMRRNHRSI